MYWELMWDAPQVYLFPVLFNLYIKILSKIIWSFRVGCHKWVDDNFISLYLPLVQTDRAKESCIHIIYFSLGLGKALCLQKKMLKVFWNKEFKLLLKERGAVVVVVVVVVMSLGLPGWNWLLWKTHLGGRRGSPVIWYCWWQSHVTSCMTWKWHHHIKDMQ